MGVHVMDRCNLTVLEEPEHAQLAEFLAKNNVEIIASMPCYLEDNVNAQRGTGVFAKSIKGLQKLNALGYGASDELIINLVYNPQGPNLPPSQAELEAAYKKILLDELWYFIQQAVHAGKYANQTVWQHAVIQR